MMRTEKNFNLDIEEIEEILPLQKCPYEVRKCLEYIAMDFSENGLVWVLMKAYCLGVINGKREERICKRI